MELPRFDFAPHEWPPLGVGSPEGLADAVFKVLWNGELVEVAARWVGVSKRRAFLFFQTTRNGQIYIVSHRRSAGARAFDGSCMSEKNKVKVAVEMVQKAVRGWHYSYGRAFHIPAQVWNTRGAQWLFLSHDNTGGMWNDYNPGLWQAPFRFDSEAHNSLSTMDDPDSPLRFALDWSQLSRDELLRRALQFRNGGLDELKQVIQSIALYEPSLHRPNKAGLLFFQEELSASWSYLGGLGWEGEHPNARLRRWNFHLNHYYAPRKNEELAARHLCVARLGLWPIVRVELAPPTQHERLEAALFLRDWARDIIPPDELALLLPKL